MRAESVGGDELIERSDNLQPWIQVQTGDRSSILWLGTDIDAQSRDTSRSDRTRVRVPPRPRSGSSAGRAIIRPCSTPDSSNPRSRCLPGSKHCRRCSGLLPRRTGFDSLWSHEHGCAETSLPDRVWFCRIPTPDPAPRSRLVYPAAHLALNQEDGVRILERERVVDVACPFGIRWSSNLLGRTMRRWWNRQTRRSQKPGPSGMWVRLPPDVP